MKTQRDSFWNEVYRNMKKDNDIVIVIADMGAPALDNIRRDFPNRVVDVGIAEQNAILIASGLAKEGKKVFVYAIAPFITLRCLELIRVNQSIMNIPITIVGVGAGFGYPDSGPTHFQLEDISIMRIYPNIITRSITDNIMAKYVANLCCQKNNNTNYVRLEREAVEDVYDSMEDFVDGFEYINNPLLLLTECCMISTGIISQWCLQNINKYDIIDFYTFPLTKVSETLFIEEIKNYDSIITLEEHFLPGGLGSYILEIMNDYNVRIPVKRIGFDPVLGYCYRYGGREDLREFYNFHTEGINNQIKEFLEST